MRFWKGDRETDKAFQKRHFFRDVNRFLISFNVKEAWKKKNMHQEMEWCVQLDASFYQFIQKLLQQQRALEISPHISSCSLHRALCGHSFICGRFVQQLRQRQQGLFAYTNDKMSPETEAPSVIWLCVRVLNLSVSVSLPSPHRTEEQIWAQKHYVWVYKAVRTV